MGTVDLAAALLSALLRERPLEAERVREGLSSPSPRCREIALRLAARDVRAFAPEVLRGWLRSPALRPELEQALKGDPLLAFESRRPAQVGSGEPDPEGPALQAWFAPERVRRVLAAYAELERGAEGPERTRLLERLPGLHQLAAYAAGPLTAAEQERLAACLARREAQRFPGQLAVSPSYRCDRHCAYCLSLDLQRRAGRELDLDEFRRILDVSLSGGQVRRVSLFGGEPTAFPGIAGFARELDRRGLRFFFSTHGLADPERFDELLESPSLEEVTLHVGKRAAYSDEERERLLRNARALGRRAGVQAVVRYNLTDEGKRDWSFLAPVLSELPGVYFGFAVAFPVESRRNQHVDAARLEQFAPKILALVRSLEEALPQVSQIALAKPFPPCAFSDAELSYLLGRIGYHNICEVHRRGFTDQVLVHPDFTVSPCMALTEANLAVAGPRPLDELGPVFAARLADRLAAPLLARCARCILFRSGTCQAACYAYTH